MILKGWRCPVAQHRFTSANERYYQPNESGLRSTTPNLKRPNDQVRGFRPADDVLFIEPKKVSKNGFEDRPADSIFFLAWCNDILCHYNYW